MSMDVVAHLNFRGDARAALAFYQSVFGGDQQIMTFKDAGRVQDPAEADQVIWGQVTASSGFRIMAFDVPSDTGWDQGENAFFVSVSSESSDEISAVWSKLCEGGIAQVPLAPAFWSPLYGKVKDRFGVVWILSAMGT